MIVGEAIAVEFGIPEFWNEIVNHPGGEKTVPSQGSAMDMADNPIGKMG